MMGDPEQQTAEDARRRAARRALLEGLLTLELHGTSDFDDPSLEGRRLFAEMLGTFFLVLVGAGAAVVSAASHDAIGRAAAVSAPGLTVMAIILAIGGVSGAHLNPAVSIAFAARGDFPWRRVPGYIAAQATGSVLACLFLWSVFGKIGILGATEPGRGIGDPHAALIEGVLTLGLVSTVLGTASGAQNLGPLSALGVSAYVILSGRARSAVRP